MEHQITIVSVTDSKEPNTMSTLVTEILGVKQYASVETERAEKLRPYEGKAITLEEFRDLMLEPIF